MEVASRLIVRVEADALTLKRVFVFNRPVSVAEASRHIFRTRGNSVVTEGREGALSTRFRLDPRGGIQEEMLLRPELLNAYLRAGLITTAAGTGFLPSWVPPSVRQEVMLGRFKGRVTRYPGTGEWGDIVVWHKGAQVEIYQEFPSNLDYYRRIANDGQIAHWNFVAYTELNKNMRKLVDAEGMSPERALSELRRQGDCVASLILQSVYAIFLMATSILDLNAAMIKFADPVSQAASRVFKARMGSTIEKYLDWNGKEVPEAELGAWLDEQAQRGNLPGVARVRGMPQTNVDSPDYHFIPPGSDPYVVTNSEAPADAIVRGTSKQAIYNAVGAKVGRQANILVFEASTGDFAALTDQEIKQKVAEAFSTPGQLERIIVVRKVGDMRQFVIDRRRP